jgi:DNA-binding transcriptional ArsR family regulator
VNNVFSGDVQDLEVIDAIPVAAAVLDPIRSQILEALAEPGSATTVAAAIGASRQKVNYHLRTLEEQGLVRLVEERPRRGLTERVMVASARSYVVSPAVLGVANADPDRVDRLSSDYLIALGARLIREVDTMARQAKQADQQLATLAIDTDIRFGSAGRRAEFTRELAEAVTSLAAKYHDEESDGGRWHRLGVGAHPRPAATVTSAAEPTADNTDNIASDTGNASDTGQTAQRSD